MRLNSLALLLVSLVLPPTTHAQLQDSATTAATRAAEQWLKLVDAGDFGASWDSAAPAFKQAVSRADWEQAVTRARAPFEPFGTRDLAGATWQDHLPGAPPGEYVIIQYRTAVAGGQHVLETIVPMKTNGEWKVSGYFVRPE